MENPVTTTKPICPECARLQQQMRHYRRTQNWECHARICDILAAHVRKCHAGGI